jgi:hypothetical protein
LIIFPGEQLNIPKTGADPRNRHILLLGDLSNETLEIFSTCGQYEEYNVSTATDIKSIFSRHYDETKYHVVNVPSPAKGANISAELTAAKLKIIIDEMHKKFRGFSYASVQPGNHSLRRREDKKLNEVHVWSELMDYCQANYFWGCKVVHSIVDTVNALSNDNEFTLQLEKYAAKPGKSDRNRNHGSLDMFEGLEHPLLRAQVHRLAEEYCKVPGHTFTVIHGVMADEFRSIGRIVTL